MTKCFFQNLLLHKHRKHLAFVSCRHETTFSFYDSANEREESRFLEEISNFEARILQECFRFDKDLMKTFGGWTGEMVITGENSEIIHHEYAF